MSKVLSEKHKRKIGEAVRKALKGRSPSKQCLEAAAKTMKVSHNTPEFKKKMHDFAIMSNMYQRNLNTPKAKRNLFMNLARGERHWNWKNGASKEEYGEEFTKFLKKKILERDGYFCQWCVASQSNLKNKLVVHHIDCNKKNNSINNLVTLCRSCHGKFHANQMHAKIKTSLFIQRSDNV